MTFFSLAICPFARLLRLKILQAELRFGLQKGCSPFDETQVPSYKLHVIGRPRHQAFIL